MCMRKRLNRRGRVIVAVVVAVAVALAGVIVATAEGSSNGKLELLSAVPAGYVPDPASTGRLSRDAAAASTVIAADTLRPRLEGFRTGQVKQWQSGERYIKIAAYRFGSAGEARRLMQLQLDYARSLAVGGARVTGEVKGAPGASSFYVQGDEDSDGTMLFIWGSWFTRGNVAYLVELGGSQPASTALLVELTRRQYRLVD